MTIELSRQMEERLSAHVASGAFPSVQDVVAAALEEFLQAGDDGEDLAQALDEGIRDLDSGQSMPLEEFDRDMRSRYGIPG